MQYPKQQAELFKLLSTVSYYLLSGYSNVGFLAVEKWNPFYSDEYNVNVFVNAPHPLTFQKRPMHSYVVVNSYRTADEGRPVEGNLAGGTKRKRED